jgi:thiosulfate reductase cytochrome b subunit
VGTFVKVAIALLIVVSVVTILVTPDPTDDVLGVVHQHQMAAFHLVFLSLVYGVALAVTAALRNDATSEELHSPDLIDLVCVRLC